ncbi:hypothetical protein ACLOJK_009100 [Asimina triloba]
MILDSMQSPTATPSSSKSGRRRLLPRRQTHHRQTPRSIIQVVHRIADDEFILDPVRPQPTVDHNNKQRRALLLRRRRSHCLLLRSTTIFNLNGTISMPQFFGSNPTASIQARINSKAAPSIFFRAPIRLSIAPKAVCFVDDSGRPLDWMIQATHHNHDVGSNSPQLRGLRPSAVRSLPPTAFVDSVDRQPPQPRQHRLSTARTFLPFTSTTACW